MVRCWTFCFFRGFWDMIVMEERVLSLAYFVKFYYSLFQRFYYGFNKFICIQ